MTHDHGPTEEKPFQHPFMQQQLGSMYPTHSPGSVILVLFFVAIIFIPVGVSVVFLSDQIFELDIRYDDINECKYNPDSGAFSFPFDNATVQQGCRTRTKFTIDKSLSPPIYMYYRIVGFHQNYRQYAKSRDDNQLGGAIDDISDDCWPFEHPGQYAGDESKSLSITVEDDDGSSVVEQKTYDDMVYNPCGSIAWSMFNDTLSIYKIPDGTTVNRNATDLPKQASLMCNGSGFDENGDSTSSNENCVKKGIALDPDVENRFKLPSKYTSTQWSRAGHNTSDPFLSEGYYAHEPGHKLPNVTDEDLMVWMRTAGLPDFRKLYRKIDATLIPGDYLLAVDEFFDTTSFGAEKHLILATTSGFGGRNFVLGIALIVLGCVAFVLAVAFIAITIVKKSSTK